MKLTSYTFTEEELRKVVKNTIYDFIHSLPIDELSLHKHLLDLMEPNADIDDIVNAWCDFCLESFFDMHDDISDVLLLDENNTTDLMVYKTWMAAR